MRKSIIAFVLCFAGFTAAHANIECACPFDGLYLGASGGASFASAAENSTFNSLYNFPVPTTVHDSALMTSHAVHSNSGKGVIFTGLGKTYLNYYGGIEAFASFSKHQLKRYSSSTISGFLETDFTSTIHGSADFKLRDIEYGFDLRPGILVSPTTLFYGRVGVAFNRLSATVNPVLSEAFLSPTFSPPENLTFASSFSSKKNLTGLRLGLGFEKYITPHLVLRLDYIYTQYGTISFNNMGNQFQQSINRGPTFETITANGKVRGYNNTFLLGISYYFLDPAQKDLASASGPCSIPFCGFYSGIAGGLSWMTSKEHAAGVGSFVYVDQNNFTDRLPFVSKGGLKSTSLKGNVYAGYGIANNCFYLGSELFVNFSHHKMRSSGSYLFDSEFEGEDDGNAQTSLKTTVRFLPVNFGIDLRPGLLLGDASLFYARVGVEYNRIKINSNVASLETYPTPAFPVQEEPLISLPLNIHRNLPGLRLGCGLEQYITESIALRLDYIFTYYKSIMLSGSNSGSFQSQNFASLIALSQSAAVKIKPYNNTVLLGLSYYFY